MLEIILYRTLAVQWSLYPTSHTDSNVHCIYQAWPFEVLREAVGGGGGGGGGGRSPTLKIHLQLFLGCLSL